MATQWTAGLTDNTSLPAATLNTIGAVWETWTPTVTASSGTITTGATTLARYARVQKLVFVMFNYNITTAGTAAGAFLISSFPVPPLAAYPVGGVLGGGREFQAVGFSLDAYKISATTFRVGDYAGAAWIQSGRGCSIQLCYEAD